uniref:PH domain-containing protein n=1 Tax=Bursaphelenchus xylophilus TaxID=6326 RepID=A0A1I7S7J9_BURXY
MEDDNALDIVKWLFREDTKVDLEGNLKIIEKDSENEWNARLKGNLLALRPVAAVAEPLLLVCERIVVKRVADTKQPQFAITYGQSEVVFQAEDEDKLFDWMVKLAISSHQKTQAELDQVLNEFNMEAARITAETRAPSSPLSHFFLTSPIKKDHTFSVFHSFNMPNRTISCEEAMYESKLSIIIPTCMIKIFEKWWIELRNDLLEHLANLRNASMDAASHYVIRHLNSNLEVYSQMREFMDDYSGPNFRPSKEKYRLAFSLVPTNLHVQSFEVSDHKWTYITCGAISGTPLRFKQGGLSRLRDTLMASLQPNSQDYLLETRFFTRRKTLLNAKKMVGELSRRIENDWKMEVFGKVDKVGIKLFSEVKQLYELIVDLINSFPNIHNLVDALCPGGLAQLEAVQGQPPKVTETLAAQMDALEAAVISLNTKMAVIDKVEDQDSQSDDGRFGGATIRRFFPDRPIFEIAICCTVQFLTAAQCNLVLT